MGRSEPRTAHIATPTKRASFSPPSALQWCLVRTGRLAGLHGRRRGWDGDVARSHLAPPRHVHTPANPCPKAAAWHIELTECLCVDPRVTAAGAMTLEAEDDDSARSPSPDSPAPFSLHSADPHDRPPAGDSDDGAVSGTPELSPKQGGNVEGDDALAALMAAASPKGGGVPVGEAAALLTLSSA
jgi:hypothetical protein